MDRLGRSRRRSRNRGRAAGGLEGSGPEAKNQFKVRPQVRKARTWAVWALLPPSRSARLHGQTLNRFLRHRAKPHQKKEQIHGAENVSRALSTRTSRYESRSEIWPLNLPTMSLRARKRGFGRSAALQIRAGLQDPSAPCRPSRSILSPLTA